MAQEIEEGHSGSAPAQADELTSLTGVGPYAAAAVACFAFGQKSAPVDSNFSRLYSRYFGLRFSERPTRDKRLARLATRVLPKQGAKEFNYAVLDFAATVCRKSDPQCTWCPLRNSCSSPSCTTKTRKLTGIDLFAGAGGLSLGAVVAGLHIVCAVEHDRRPAATYEYNFPNTPVAKQRLHPSGVVALCRTLGLSEGSIDVILAGPPCQGFSIGNLRTRNEANPDNHAWRVLLTFTRHLRPRSVVIENVGGMETYRDGEVVEEMQQRFRKLGYACCLYRLNAVDFGVPQHRKRVFLLAARDFKLPESIRTPGTSPVTVGEALRDLPRVPNGNRKDVQPYRLFGAALSGYQRSMRRGANGSAGNCSTSMNTVLTQSRFAHVPPGGNWQDIPTELFESYTHPENCHRWLYRRLAEDRPAITISNFRKNMLIHPWQDRTLTVREAARLQGIHDGFTFQGNLQSQQQQVANAVPPQLARAVVGEVVRLLRRSN